MRDWLITYDASDPPRQAELVDDLLDHVGRLAVAQAQNRSPNLARRWASRARSSATDAP
jgi:hypothetical protein